MASQTAVAPLFNGNISETFWRTAGDNKIRKYGYQYDNLNRLTNAIYQDPAATLVTNSYNESITYDKNGNIQTLNRKGFLASAPFNTTIDNLVYSYGSTNKNELRRVADGTNAQGFKNGSNTDDDYAYDANGNMITDKNKGITAISYNQLNLPVKIEFGTNKIEYLYNATGQKMQKKVTQGSTVTTTDYLGGFQYNGTVLDFFPHAEGYIKRETTGVYTYVFNYTDHLGNVRVSYKKNGSALQILEESNYYPFGLKHEPNTVVNNQPSYKYKYNGKELQDELGLNMYDYGARNYDPALGRWMNIDPLAENSRRWTPYNYAYNSPMRFVDPDGMQAKWVPTVNGNMIAEKGDNAKTLSKQLNISEKKAQQMIDKQGVKKDSDGNVKAGQKVMVSNNMSRSIQESKGPTIAQQEKDEPGRPSIDMPRDSYNCWEGAQAANNGEEINHDTATKYGQFSSETPGYTEVENFDNVPIGKGIAVIGTSAHYVANYTQSKDGTQFVYSKDGQTAKPQIYSLKDLINKFNKNQGTNFTMKDVRYFKKN